MTRSLQTMSCRQSPHNHGKNLIPTKIGPNGIYGNENRDRHNYICIENSGPAIFTSEYDLSYITSSVSPSSVSSSANEELGLRCI